MVAPVNNESFISLGGLAFYYAYLLVFIPFIVFMHSRLKYLPKDRRRPAQWLVLANAFLAGGDLVAATAYALVYFKVLGNDSLGTTNFGTFVVQIVPLGVMATSLTMSCYYLFLGFYYRDRFHEGKNDWFMWFIYVMFAIRILLHFNPQNVWTSQGLTDLNYSALLRNAPLYLYALPIVALIGWHALYRLNDGKKEGETVTTRGFSMSKLRSNLLLMTIAIALSYVFYTVAVLLSFMLSRSMIGLLYILKTLAYMAAGWFMYQAEWQVPVRFLQGNDATGRGTHA